MSVTMLPLDYSAIKQRQQGVWSTGDYAMIGTTLQIVGERLCEAVDMHAGSSVLDVAAGNGNATLAAAHRFAHVTSTDYVGALLERGKERAAAERLPATMRTAFHVAAIAMALADRLAMLTVMGRSSRVSNLPSSAAPVHPRNRQRRVPAHCDRAR